MRTVPPPRALVWGGLSGLAALLIALSVWTSMARSGAGLPAGSGRGTGSLEAPGDYGAVPSFSLIERSGGSITLDDLRGRWWVANLIFTRCGSVCPMMSAHMARLAASVPGLDRGDVRFVSISVDPDHDTPGVLADYAARYVPPRADDVWLFLTGPRDQIHALAADGLHLSEASGEDEAPSPETITHSERFVLIDPAGRIRGYYHGTEPDAVERLAADLDRLRSGS